jgi:hypothetical protein
LTYATLNLNACSGTIPAGTLHDVYQVNLFNELTVSSVNNCTAPPTSLGYITSATSTNGHLTLDLTSVAQSALNLGSQFAIKIGINANYTQLQNFRSEFCTKESGYPPLLTLGW